MKPEAQCIAIAQACKTHKVDNISFDSERITVITDSNGNIKSITRRVDDECETTCTDLKWVPVSDYLNDLNALAAARDQLINTLELRIKWVNTLRTVVGKTTINRNKLGNPIVSDIDLLFAKPEQLAETLLRTLNLWKS